VDQLNYSDKPMKIRVLACFLCVSAPIWSGCVYTAYSGKDGVKLTRISLFGNQTVGKVDLEKGTMTGYQSEQAEAAAAVVEAAVRAAVKP
jgi:hypothetical protein